MSRVAGHRESGSGINVYDLYISLESDDIRYLNDHVERRCQRLLRGSQTRLPGVSIPVTEDGLRGSPFMSACEGLDEMADCELMVEGRKYRGLCSSTFLAVSEERICVIDDVILAGIEPCQGKSAGDECMVAVRDSSRKKVGIGWLGLANWRALT